MPCRLPRRPASRPTRRAATCRSKDRPPTTRAYRNCCSVTSPSLLAAGRVVTTQAVGGTGALKLGADFLKRLLPDATVAISDPSWGNHRALFEAAGFPVQNYRYYDAASNGVNRAGLLEDLNALPARSIVVLHACCHNPTGVDLGAGRLETGAGRAQGQGPRAVPRHRLPGLGNGIEEDAAAVRLFAQSGLSFFVSSSFSKSFSLSWRTRRRPLDRDPKAAMNRPACCPR
ncbi:aminotransferase class I/II-fold pyridoxal phosphate-dependent enzyme [Pseudomonas aeruginosa]